MSPRVTTRASADDPSAESCSTTEREIFPSDSIVPKSPRFASGKISGCEFPRCAGSFKTGSFCNICECVYCDDCWKLAPSHKTDRAGNQKTKRAHEKTDETLAKAVNDILDPERSDVEFKHEVAEDETTKWFGMQYPDKAEDSEPSSSITLFNTRRLQEILETAKKPVGEPQYPSIISFVGETGSGKSTLIKALIEMNGPDSLETIPKNVATPVVASSAHEFIPTSSNVHLYGDPSTLHTENPLLFADCEGLKGGNREPTTETAWKKLMKEGLEILQSEQSQGKSSNRLRDRALNRTLQVALNLTARLDSRRVLARDISLADGKKPVRTYTRQYVVENIYSRLLYAFSDTIVFVTRNSKTIESVFELLIEWAEAGFEHTANQPVLPAAFIVLNAVAGDGSVKLSASSGSESETPSLKIDRWDTSNQTNAIFDSFCDLGSKNSRFTELLRKWNTERISPQSSQIRGVRDLLLRYYSAVQIISIPNGEQPNRFYHQLQSLYNRIQEKSKNAHVKKIQERMSLTYLQLVPYLNYAFDHFSEGLNQAFNFVNIAFQENPIPADFSGGILQLLIAIQEHVLANPTERGMFASIKTGANLGREAEIFEAASEMIASAIMLDSTRNKKLGNADQIFPNYRHRIRSAFYEFAHRFYICEFERKSLNPLENKVRRCVNVRSGHTKGHQHISGRIIGTGDFVSALGAGLEGNGATIFFAKLEASIKSRLTRLLGELSIKQVRDKHKEEAILAGQLHRSQVLVPFFKRFKNMKRNTLCLSCLAEKPMYHLECGHSVCQPCVRCYGRKNLKVPHRYELRGCPMCGVINGTSPRPMVIDLIHTETSGRVLNLEGSGFAGIIQLETLALIEREIGLGIPIQQFFDLIVGTSCGGLVALGLGVQGWSIEECNAKFVQLCQGGFRARYGADSALIGKAVRLLHKNSSFVEGALEESLRKNMGFSDNPLFGYNHDHAEKFGAVPNSRYDSIPVAVTAESICGETFVLGSYNRRFTEDNLTGNKVPYRFPRAPNFEKELSVWQAARTTFAAPGYFKPFMPTSVDLLLHDATNSFNNPVEIAVSEWHNYSGNPDRSPLDLLLSVGTGYRIQAETPGGKTSRRSHFTRSLRLSRTEPDCATDSATIWSNFLAREPQRTEHELQSGKYARINIPLNIIEALETNPYQLIRFLQNAAMGSLHERKMEWRTLSNRLITTSFYFHLESLQAHIDPVCDSSISSKADASDADVVPLSTSYYRCKGRICCRIQTQLSRTKGSMSKFQARLPNAEFRITHSGSTTDSESNRKVSITSKSLSALCKNDIHRGSANSTRRAPLAWHLEVEFLIPSRDSTTSISLASSEGDLGAISAFPRHLVQEWEAAQKELENLTSHGRKKRRDPNDQGDEPGTPASTSTSGERNKHELDAANIDLGRKRSSASVRAIHNFDGKIDLKSSESVNFYNDMYGEKYKRDFGTPTISRQWSMQ